MDSKTARLPRMRLASKLTGRFASLLSGLAARRAVTIRLPGDVYRRHAAGATTARCRRRAPRPPSARASCAALQLPRRASDPASLLGLATLRPLGSCDAARFRAAFESRSQRNASCVSMVASAQDGPSTRAAVYRADSLTRAWCYREGTRPACWPRRLRRPRH